jgi:hypothetical protein
VIKKAAVPLLVLSLSTPLAFSQQAPEDQDDCTTQANNEASSTLSRLFHLQNLNVSSSERSKLAVEVYYKPRKKPLYPRYNRTHPKYFNTVENQNGFLNIKKTINLGQVFGVEFADYRSSSYSDEEYTKHLPLSGNTTFRGKYISANNAWIGVYESDADNHDYLGYSYIQSGFGNELFAQKKKDSRSKGWSSSYSITHSPITKTGSYEVRLFGDNTYNQLLAKVSFTVIAEE